MNAIELKKSFLIPPGETIQETIDEINMSQVELAERIGRSIPKLNDLIKGKASITREVATKLEYVLGIPSSFWLNLESLYQQQLSEIEQLELLESSKEWTKGFPLNVLKKLGVVSNTRKRAIVSEELLRFFRVASPLEWEAVYVGQYTNVIPNYKIDKQYTHDPKAISSWLRIGEVQSENIELEEFSKTRISQSLPRIHEIAYHFEDSWFQELQDVCASFGVALVFTPCIPKAPIYGASRWIRNKTVPLIQVTDRRKDYNAFWFTFFHELAHIRYHNKSDIFIDGEGEIQIDNEKEDQADEFASRMLLTEKQRIEILNLDFYDEYNILELSESFQRHPSLIVSFLQREEEVLYHDVILNSLKARVELPVTRLR